MNEGLNNEAPKFSIIIPAYRVEKYICQCIDSVLAQTFTDFELILVDDGSDDRCGEICGIYGKSDSRIIVIHKPNGGLSDARNAGFLIANGEYIYFLDGDDWVANRLLECVIRHMNQGYDMVVFNYYTAYSQKICSEITHLSGEFSINSEIERTEFYYSTLLKAVIGWSAWDRVFKKSIIDEYEITYADNQKIFMEDLYFSCCYCAFAKRIQVIGDRLLFYRQREDSIMHTDGAGLNFNRVNEFSKELLHYFTNYNCRSLVDIFPQLYFCLMRNNIWKLEKQKNLGLSDIRLLMEEDINDKLFFKSQMRGLQSQRYISEKAYSKREFIDMKSTARYLLNGRAFSFEMRSRLINAFQKKSASSMERG